MIEGLRREVSLCQRNCLIRLNARILPIILFEASAVPPDATKIVLEPGPPQLSRLDDFQLVGPASRTEASQTFRRLQLAFGKLHIGAALEKSNWSLSKKKHAVISAGFL